MTPARPARPRRRVAWLLACAAVALLVASIVPGVVTARGMALALGEEATVTMAASEALVWDGDGPRRGGLELTRTVATAPTDVDSVAGVTARSELRLDGQVLASLDDAVDLNRESAYPQADGAHRQTLTVAGNRTELDTELSTEERVADTNRAGLKYFFPAKTEKRSYAFFDALAQDSQPLDYAETDKVASDAGASTAYVFRQSLAAVPLPESVAAALPQRQLTGTAADFYTDDERAALGLSAATAVVLDPFYAAQRTVRVEPTSGLILDEELDVRLLFATDAVQADIPLSFPPTKRAILVADFRWDDASRAAAVERASRTSRLHQYMAALGWAGKALAVLLAGLAAWTYRRGRHA